MSTKTSEQRVLGECPAVPGHPDTELADEDLGPADPGRWAWRAIRATIRYRLLVNALADPEEVAPRLPDGLRPHATSEGCVIGHCLVDLDHVRAAPVPRRAGIKLRAVAHRMSVEWDTPHGDVAVGVYVPTRHTDSLPGCALGGRWFPGVHRRAATSVEQIRDRVVWTVDPAANAEFRLHVSADLSGDPADPASDSVAAVCLLPTQGMSPGHDGAPEAVQMLAKLQCGQVVQVRDLQSAFIDGFETARPATSFVARDVEVAWSRLPLPASVQRPAAAAGHVVRL